MDRTQTQLLMSVHALAWQIARRYPTGSLPIESEDLYQSAMATLAASIDAYDPERCAFTSFAYRRLWVGAYRAFIQAHWQKSLRARDDLQPTSLSALGDLSVSDDYESDLLACLSEPDRRVALLMAEGFTQVEIAKQLQVTHQAVGQRVSRIRRLLAAEIEQ